ncbi:ovarian cancer G-protein coupled receptor 1 [Lepisosteus oculatus]|uniref:G protein-coupled receptor 68 n=1 Tax=Lepisosteus oculatus TaxID=7918 RepID=W5NMG3_LEPOC|nr:PREDICTED: ovarian cancer G-protein coupled receptor 1 [Lepisosteus oculatus]XP_015206418.1 PREDICTED: ovarian cancer G-protein coupled receptor 1 [Lepisosteus oculatus]
MALNFNNTTEQKNMSQDDLINCTNKHDIHQYLFSWVYILVLIIGLPTNLYSLYHAWQQLKARNELGIYLINLTVSDLLYLSSLPLWLQYIFLGDDWRHNEWLCKVCGFLLYENIYISIGFLCCISLDRYLAVVHPFRFSCLRTMKAAALASIFIWIKEIGISMAFFFRKELSTDKTNHSICFEHYPMRSWEKPVNYYRFFIGFLFPLGMLSWSYCRVLMAVNKSTGTQTSQKSRIRHLVSSTILIFLCSFSPYHIFLLVRTIFETNCDFIDMIFNYYHFSLMLTSFNCLADPVLYCFVSEHAQRDMQWVKGFCTQLFCCKREGTTDFSDTHTPHENGASGIILLNTKEGA